MIKSMTLRPYCQSSIRFLGYGIGGPRNFGNPAHSKAPLSVLQLKSCHGLLPSRGRTSCIGIPSDNNGAHRITYTKESLRNLNQFGYPSNISSVCRLLSTSGTPNASTPKKDGDNASKNEKDESHSTLVTEKNSFQSMFRRYGKVFVSTYLAVYVSTVLGLFMSVQSGHLDAMYIISLLTGTSAPAEPGGVADPDTIKEAASAMKDIVELLESYTLTRPVAPMIEEYPWTANFAIAWIATKFTEPIRFGVTVVLTPPIARFFGYRSIPAVIRNGPIDFQEKKR